MFGVMTGLLSLAFMLPIRLLPVRKTTKRCWLLTCISVSTAAYIKIMQSLGLINFSQQGPPLASIRGHLIVANHPSLIDALFITAATKNLCCIVKSGLLQNPFTRYIVMMAGYIPNNSHTLLCYADKTLAAGTNLLIFPEGTRNTSDLQLDFKRGAANIALSADCPITPVVITFKPRTLQKGDRWYAVPRVTPTVVMRTYPPLTALDYVDETSPVTLQVRQLNKALKDFFHQAISSQTNSGLEDPTMRINKTSAGQESIRATKPPKDF